MGAQSRALLSGYLLFLHQYLLRSTHNSASKRMFNQALRPSWNTLEWTTILTPFKLSILLVVL